MLLCCISRTRCYYGKQRTDEKGMLSQMKDFGIVVLNSEQSNADIRHKIIFHCESSALERCEFFLYFKRMGKKKKSIQDTMT